MPIDITTIEDFQTAPQPQRLAPYTVPRSSCATDTGEGGLSPLSIRSNTEFSTWPTAQAVHKSAIGNAKVSNMPCNLFDSDPSIHATYSVSHKMRNEGVKIPNKGIKKTQRLIGSGRDFH
jgi:hypothetical protein